MTRLGAALTWSAAILSAASGPASADVLDRQFDIVCPIQFQGKHLTDRVYSIDVDRTKVCTRDEDGSCISVDTFQADGSLWTLVKPLNKDGFDFRADFVPGTDTVTELSTIDGKPYTKVVSHCTRRALTPLPAE